MNSPIIIAELSSSHLGSFERAEQLVIAAAYAGADAIKLQTFTPEDMVADKEYIIQDGPWEGRSLYDLYQEAQTPWEWHEPLFSLANGLGMGAFSSPFSVGAVDRLESIGCEMYKIASFEINDIPLLRRVAKTGKPVIISAGMASEEEINTAMGILGPDTLVLSCTSAYPAPENEIDLINMRDGLSDHTRGIGVACAAAALGAKVIEKHLTLDRNDGGLDSAFSLEPEEFKQLVIETKRASMAMEESTKQSEQSSRSLRRSLYFTRDIEMGVILTEKDIRTARPALGISASQYDTIIGRMLEQDVKSAQPVERVHVGLQA